MVVVRGDDGGWIPDFDEGFDFSTELGLVVLERVEENLDAAFLIIFAHVVHHVEDVAS
jgi:hypothetical protein